MAYSYFTKKLIAKSDVIDLATIFAEKQEAAKNRLNTNYSLPEIVDWIQQNTNNFKKSDNYFIDLDQAVQRVINKYYVTINQPNPFMKIDIGEEEDIDLQQPRVPVEVTTEGVKSGKPDVAAAISEQVATTPRELTREDFITAIEGLEIQAELDPDNPIYIEVIEGLKVQLELMS